MWICILENVGAKTKPWIHDGHFWLNCSIMFSRPILRYVRLLLPKIKKKMLHHLRFFINLILHVECRRRLLCGPFHPNWWGLSSFTCVGWRCSSCWSSCLQCLGRSEAAPFRLPPAVANRYQTFLLTLCLAGPNLKTVLGAASLLSSISKEQNPS